MLSRAYLLARSVTLTAYATGALYAPIAARQPSGVIRSPPAAHRYRAAVRAASSMSFGLGGLPSGEVPQCNHVDGMNCIGPIAWSHLGSPSSTLPAAVAGTALVPCEPSSGGPRIRAEVMPSGSRVAPPKVPCPDSTAPMPASIVQVRWQSGAVATVASWASAYALSARAGMPVRVATVDTQLAETAAGFGAEPGDPHGAGEPFDRVGT